MSLKSRGIDDMKMALRARETDRLKTIRMLLAAIKQREVDERIEISDPDVLAVIDKMIKQRRESIGQFERAGRHDLADSEKAEVAVLQEYMPQALSEGEIDTLVTEAITSVGAASVKDMGAVMALIRPKLTGRANIGAVSQLVKAKLSR